MADEIEIRARQHAAPRREQQQQRRRRGTTTRTTNTMTHAASLVRFQEDKEHTALKERLLRKYVPAKSGSEESSADEDDAEATRLPRGAKRQRRTASAMSAASASGVASEEGNSNSNWSAASRLERQMSGGSASNSSDDGGSSLSQSRRVLAARSKRFLEQYEAEADFHRRLRIAASDKHDDVEMFEALIAQSAAETARLAVPHAADARDSSAAAAATAADQPAENGGSDRLRSQQQPIAVRRGKGRGAAATTTPDLDSEEDDLVFRKPGVRPAARKRRRPAAAALVGEAGPAARGDGDPEATTTMSNFFGSALAQNRAKSQRSGRGGRSRRHGIAGPKPLARQRRPANVIEIDDIEDDSSEDEGLAEGFGHPASRPGISFDDSTPAMPSQMLSRAIKGEPEATVDLALSDIEDEQRDDENSESFNVDEDAREAKCGPPSRESSTDAVTGTSWIANQLQKQQSADALSPHGKTLAALLRQDEAVRVSPRRPALQPPSMFAGGAAGAHGSHRRAALHSSSSTNMTRNARFQSLLGKARTKFAQSLTEQLHFDDQGDLQAPVDSQEMSLEVFVRKSKRVGRLLHLDCVIVSAPPDDVDNDDAGCRGTSGPALVRGLPVRVIMPRAGRPELEADSPRAKARAAAAATAAGGKSAVKREHSLAVASYDYIARMMDQLGHLKGAEVAADLEGTRIALQWPWCRLQLRESLDASASAHVLHPGCTIVTPGVVSIVELRAECPSIVQVDALTCFGETSAASPAQAKGETSSDADAICGSKGDDGRDEAGLLTRKTASLRTKNLTPFDSSWLRVLNPSGPRTQLASLRGHVAGVLLRECLLVQNGEAFVGAKLAPPGTRYSSILLAVRACRATWYCEVLVAPQHVFRFMNALGEDDGGLFELTNLVTLGSRPLMMPLDADDDNDGDDDGTELEDETAATAPMTPDHSEMQWASIIASGSSSRAMVPPSQQTSITTLLLSPDSQATRLTEIVKEKVRVQLPHAEAVSSWRRCEAVCCVLHGAGRTLFVAAWGAPPDEILRLELADAQVAATVTQVCPKGGWLLLRGARRVAARTYVADAMTVVERIMWTRVPLGTGSASALRTQLEFAPGPVGEMHLDAQSTNVPWCRNADLPGLAPAASSQPAGMLVNSREEASLMMPLLVRYVSLPQRAQDYLDGLEVSLPALPLPPADGRGDCIGYLYGTLRRVGWATSKPGGEDPAWRFEVPGAPITVEMALKNSRHKRLAVEMAVEGQQQTVKVRMRTSHVKAFLLGAAEKVRGQDSLLEVVKDARLSIPCYAKRAGATRVSSIVVVDEMGRSMLANKGRR